MKRIYRYAGILAPIVALGSIILAILTHPWFSFSENAISDLGAIDVEKNYILNYGLVISGILATIYSIGLYGEQRSDLGRFGSLLFLIASLFLTMIGVFPEGTPLHFPISVSFFILMYVSILLIGISTYDSEFIFFTLLIFLFGVEGSLISLLEYGSVGIAELISIITFTIWIYGKLFWRHFQ